MHLDKIISYLCCALCVFSGMIVVLFALVEEVPARQGSLALCAALLFVAALLFAGYGNAMPWKKDK